MDRYDVICESLQTLINNGSITLEFAEEVNEAAYEKYVTEAANKEYKAAMTDLNQKMKALSSRYKAAMKDGNTKEAAKILKMQKTVIGEMSKTVNSVDSDLLDVFMPLAITGLKSVANMLVANIVTSSNLMPKKLSDKMITVSQSVGKNSKALEQNKSGKIAAIVTWCGTTYPIVVNMAKKLKNSEKINMNDFNLYRTKVVKQFSILEKEIDKKIAELR